MGLGGFLQSVFANNAPRQQPIPQPTDVTGPYDNEQSYDPYAPEPSPAMDAYYNEVTNMPVRRGPSKLRMLGTGLLSALQGSTGEESRVPLRNAAGKVVGSREAGFLESLGNKPFNVGQANAILDMPYEAAVEDWKLRSEGLGKAANIEKTAESNRALAAQRYAAAQATPVRAAATAQNAETNRQKLELQQYLKDLPDSEKYKLLQEGKVSIADIQAAAAQKRVETQQTGATTRTGMQQEGATTRTGMQQEGAGARAATTAEAAMARALENNAAAMARIQAGGGGTGGIATVKDPATGQDVSVWYNPRTQKMERVQLEGQPVGAVTKPGTPSQTAGGTPAELARQQAVRDRAQETITALEELVDPKTGKLNPQISSVVGNSRRLTVPFGVALTAGQSSAEAKINFAKSNLLMGLIGEMKAQSRTGATGFGQLAVKEVEKLEAAASKLDPRMKEEDFEAEIKRIIDKLKLVMQPTPGTIKVGASSETTAPKMTAEERIRASRARRGVR